MMKQASEAKAKKSISSMERESSTPTVRPKECFRVQAFAPNSPKNDLGFPKLPVSPSRKGMISLILDQEEAVFAKR